MKKVVVSLVSATALATITAGMAAMTHSTVASSSNSSGFYVGGNLGYGHYNEKRVAKKYRGGFAFGADLGYQFNPYFALEGGYLNYGNQQIVLGTDRRDADLYALDFLAKGIYPINNQFDIFAKAGIARLDGFLSDATPAFLVSKTDKIVAMLGLGAAYNINNQLAVNIQALYTTAAKNSFRQTTAVLTGITYKFNAFNA